MPTPSFLTVAGFTAVSDAYTRIVDQLLGGKPGMAQQLDTLLNTTSRIEQAIGAQNRAHANAAKMALQRGDTDQALRALEMAMAADPLDAHAMVLYADLLTAKAQPELAKKTIAACVEWFGSDCPALHADIRQAYNSNSQIRIPNSHLDFKLAAPDTSHELGYAGANSLGLIATFENRPIWRFSDTWKVSVQFQPLDLTADLREIYSEEHWPKEDGLSTLGIVSSKGAHITRVTERFVVVDEKIALDAFDGFRQISVTPDRVRANFGATRFGVVSSYASRYRENVRGASIKSIPPDRSKLLSNTRGKWEFLLHGGR